MLVSLLLATCLVVTVECGTVEAASINETTTSGHEITVSCETILLYMCMHLLSGCIYSSITG